MANRWQWNVLTVDEFQLLCPQADHPLLVGAVIDRKIILENFYLIMEPAMYLSF